METMETKTSSVDRTAASKKNGAHDGKVQALEELADRPFSDPGFSAVERASVLGEISFEKLRLEILLKALASKVLGAHLDNRFQTSYPLVLDLSAIPPEARSLLLEVAAAAAISVSLKATQIDAAARGLVAIRADPLAIAGFHTAIDQPRALPLILAETAKSGLAEYAYAISLVTLSGITGDLAAIHLSYVAARLSLTREVTRSLDRRFRK